MFLGLRDFRTDEPGHLRSDLQRQNTLLEQASRDDAERFGERWRVLRANRDVRAVAGNALFLDATAALKVFLPPSVPGIAGRCIRVARATGAAAIAVVAASGELVNGAASVSWTASTVGWHEFMADGSGAWLSELF